MLMVPPLMMRSPPLCHVVPAESYTPTDLIPLALMSVLLELPSPPMPPPGPPQPPPLEALPEKYLAMLDAVTPRRFRLKEGTSGRYHVGFIAQEVEAAMAAAGVSDMEFGGWVKDTDEDGNDLYLLRYEEFIALLLEKLRQLEGRLEALE